MILAGTDIIEIGGQSTRPGYDEISVKKKKRRTIPVIKYIYKTCIYYILIILFQI